MDSLCQVDTAQDSLHLRDIKVLVLLEDQDFGMIVKSESLFRSLVVDDERSQPGIGLEDCHEVIAQPSVECPRLCGTVAPDDVFALRAADQLAVVQRCQWV